MAKQYVVLDSEGNPIDGATVHFEEESSEETEEGFFGKIASKIKKTNPKTVAKVLAGFTVGAAAIGVALKLFEDNRSSEEIIDAEADFDHEEADVPFTEAQEQEAYNL